VSLPIPAKEVAVGDYSPLHGTVKQVRKNKETYTEITFVNGTVITPNNDMELIIDQGGRFNHVSQTT
jgi:hypothetical protein